MMKDAKDFSNLPQYKADENVCPFKKVGYSIGYCKE